MPGAAMSKGKFKFRFRQWQQGWSWEANSAAGIGMDSGEVFFTTRAAARADALRATTKLYEAFKALKRGDPHAVLALYDGAA
jgi:hypothetical protein